MPPFTGFKKRLKQRALKPVFPSTETLIEEREKEGQRTPLFEPSQKGKEFTVSNIARDVTGTVNDLRRSPREFSSRLKTRLGRYVDRGPDINNPVPLTRNPYRTRRR